MSSLEIDQGRQSYLRRRSSTRKKPDEELTGLLRIIDNREERKPREEPSDSASPGLFGGRKWLLLCAFVGALALVASVLYGGEGFSIQGSRTNKKTPSEGELSDSEPGDAETAHGSGSSDIPSRASSSLLPDYLSDINEVMANFKEKRQELIDKLKVDYGEEYYHSIFEQDVNGTTYSRGRLAFRSAKEGGPSWERLKRKIMLRVLEVQVAFQRQSRQLGEFPEQVMEQDPWHSRLPQREGYVPFIWATGGHSSAAGHGNYHNESYTAVMERNLKDVFASVGIEFIGRNFAMGGTSSGPEIAMCIDSIFGRPDILSWDFGMTDGQIDSRMASYFLRAAMIQSRPAGVALQLGSKRAQSRVSILESLEDMGLSSIFLDDDVFDSMIQSIPDTAGGLTSQQIDALPAFVRYFRCGVQVEKGDPGCDEHKYSDLGPDCKERKHQASWHPGWKWHALTGNLMALFMTEVLGAALQEIASSSVSAGDLFSRLRAAEDADFGMLKESKLPEVVEDVLSQDVTDDLDKISFLMGPNFCHTARLPSESRYLGVLTEEPSKTGDNYDAGTSDEEAATSFTTNGGPMRLIYSESDREHCEAPTYVDYKDWFEAHHREGWKSVTVPNESENKMFGSGERPSLQGVVAICFIFCPWGKCPAGVIMADELKQGMGEMKVNGQKVVSLTQIDAKDKACHFLKNENGYRWKPNTDGRLEIQARAVDPGTSFRISSFIVW